MNQPGDVWVYLSPQATEAIKRANVEHHARLAALRAKRDNRPTEVLPRRQHVHVEELFIITGEDL